jgi:cytochrome c oxidase assembly protein subunit 15
LENDGRCGETSRGGFSLRWMENWMIRSEANPWLHRFAVLTAVATLILIAIGGLVTSHGVGMAVPDWPTTYGYNMFFFPFSKWVGGIFYEHTHRLFASFVGLLTTILAVWLWLRESRPWLRWMGVAAFFGVVLQGVLGGLRVTLLKDQIGIFHGMLAQAFLVLVCLIALFTSKYWRDARGFQARMPQSACWTLKTATVLIFLQLGLGATMRHQHAGLAVPDFPFAYGRWWPPMDAASVAAINQHRMEARDFKPITAPQIALHMTHRMVAVLALCAVAGFVIQASAAFRENAGLRRWSRFWLAILILQAILGIATVLSDKAADIATAHVVVGAFSLVCGAVIWALTSGWNSGLKPHSPMEAGNAD